MIGNEKIKGRDLKERETIEFRCKNCGKKLAEVEKETMIRIVCSRCKTINEF